MTEPFALADKRLEESPVTAKPVVVALVEVEFRAVKFASEEEPVTARFVVVAVPKIVRPWVPLPIVEEAETMRPTVEVGAM